MWTILLLYFYVILWFWWGKLKLKSYLQAMWSPLIPREFWVLLPASVSLFYQRTCPTLGCRGWRSYRRRKSRSVSGSRTMQQRLPRLENPRHPTCTWTVCGGEKERNVVLWSYEDNELLSSINMRENRLKLLLIFYLILISFSLHDSTLHIANYNHL